MQSLAGALLPLLIDVAIKGFTLLLLAFATTLLMRRASAAARHLAWFLAVAAMLTLPLFSATLPGWHILPHWLSNDESALVMPASTQNPGPIAQAPPHDELFPPPPSPPIPPADQDTQLLPLYPPPAAPQPEPKTASPALPQLPPAETAAPPAPRWHWSAGNILLAWMIGSIVYCCYILLGCASLWRLRRRSSPITDPAWLGPLDQARRSLGFHRPIQLIGSASRDMPMTWGLWRAWILLPADAADWPPERRRAVLLHELAHAKRWDCLSQLIAQLAIAFYWFNPLLWLAWKRMQAEREQACDDLVLGTGAKASAYAEQLLHLAASAPAVRFSAAAIAMARPGQLERRLRAILDTKRSRRTITWTAAVALALVMAAVAVPLAMVRAGETKPIPIADDRAPLPTDFAGRLVAGIARQHLSFLDAQKLANVQAQLADFDAQHVPRNLPDARRQAILSAIDGYAATRFHNSSESFPDDPTAQDSLYLGFADAIKTFEWQLWLAANRQPLSPEQETQRQAQRQWIQQFIRSLPPEQGATQAGVSGEIDGFYADPLDPLFSTPMTTEQFAKLKKFMNADTVGHELLYASALCVQKAWDACYPRIESLPTPFAHGVTGSWGIGGTEISLGFAENEAWMGNSVGVSDFRKSRDVIGLVPPRYRQCPASMDTDAKKMQWLADQGKDDLAYDDTVGGSLIGPPGTKLLQLNVHCWIDADRIDDADLRQTLEQTGQPTFSLAAARKRYSPPGLSADCFIGVLTANGKLAVVSVESFDPGIGLFIRPRGASDPFAVGVPPAPAPLPAAQPATQPATAPAIPNRDGRSQSASADNERPTVAEEIRDETDGLRRMLTEASAAEQRYDDAVKANGDAEKLRKLAGPETVTQLDPQGQTRRAQRADLALQLDLLRRKGYGPNAPPVQEVRTMVEVLDAEIKAGDTKFAAAYLGQSQKDIAYFDALVNQLQNEISQESAATRPATQPAAAEPPVWLEMAQVGTIKSIADFHPDLAAYHMPQDPGPGHPSVVQQFTLEIRSADNGKRIAELPKAGTVAPFAIGFDVDQLRHMGPVPDGDYLAAFVSADHVRHSNVIGFKIDTKYVAAVPPTLRVEPMPLGPGETLPSVWVIGTGPPPGGNPLTNESVMYPILIVDGVRHDLVTRDFAMRFWPIQPGKSYEAWIHLADCNPPIAPKSQYRVQAQTSAYTSAEIMTPAADALGPPWDAATAKLAPLPPATRADAGNGYEDMLYALGAFPVAKLTKPYWDNGDRGKVYMKGTRIDVDGWLPPNWVADLGYLTDAEKVRYGIPVKPLTYDRYVGLLDVVEYKRSHDPLLLLVMRFSLQAMQIHHIDVKKEDILRVYEAGIGLESEAVDLLKGKLSSADAMRLLSAYKDERLFDVIPAPAVGDTAYAAFLQDQAKNGKWTLVSRQLCFRLLWEMDSKTYRQPYRQFLIDHVATAKDSGDRMNLYDGLIGLKDDESFAAIRHGLTHDPSTECRNSILWDLQNRGVIAPVMDAILVIASGKDEKHEYTEDGAPGRPVAGDTAGDHEPDPPEQLDAYLKWAQAQPTDAATAAKIEKAIGLLREKNAAGKP